MQRIKEFLTNAFPLPDVQEEGKYDEEIEEIVTKPQPRINQISKLTKLQKWDDSTVVVVGYGNSPVPGIFPGFEVLQISCGCYHTAFLTRDGAVHTYGTRSEEYYMLGYEHQEPARPASGPKVVLPRRVTALEGRRIVNIASAGTYMAAVDDHGVAYSWGTAVQGQHGSTEHVVREPRPIPGLEKVAVRRIVCGRSHIAAIADEGLFTWGENKSGQLGHGMPTPTTQNVIVPTRVEFEFDGLPFDVSLGWTHSAVITSNGRLYTFGTGRTGALGHGTTEPKYLPTLVKSLMDQSICQVVCSNAVTTALTDTGVVYVWGEAEFGQLGLGPDHTTNLLIPTRIDALSHCRIMNIAGGWAHSTAVDEHGGVWAWGYNGHQQVLRSDLKTKSTPTLIFESMEDEDGDGVVFAHMAECGPYHTALFIAKHAASPTTSAAWRLSYATSTLETTALRRKATEMSKRSDTLAQELEDRERELERLRKENESLKLREMKRHDVVELMKQQSMTYSSTLRMLRLRNAMLEMHIQALALALPPASPFGADRVDRTSIDLTHLAPAERRPAGILPWFIAGLRAMFMPSIVLWKHLKYKDLHWPWSRPPTVKDYMGRLHLSHSIPKAVAAQYEAGEAAIRLHHKRQQKDNHSKRILMQWYRRQRPNGLRDALSEERIAAAVAANGGWAVSRMQAENVLMLLAGSRQDQIDLASVA